MDVHGLATPNVRTSSGMVQTFVATILCSLLLAPFATAQSLGPQAIELANDHGKKLFKQKKYREAVQVWRTAFLAANDDAELRLAKNLAIGYRKLKELDRVFYYYSFRFRRTPASQRTEKMKKSLEVIAAALASGKALVRVETEAENAYIYQGSISEESKYKFPFDWYFAPGVHTLTVTAKGMVPEERTFEVAAGEELAFDISLKPDQSLVIVNPVEPIRNPISSTGGSPVTTVASGPPTDYLNDYGPWVTVGIGVAAIATGSVYKWRAFDKGAEIEKEYQGKYEDFVSEGGENDYEKFEGQRKAAFDDEVAPLDQMSGVLWAVGGAATVGGLAWWYFTKDSPPGASAYLMTPTLTPNGTAGAMLEFGF